MSFREKNELGRIHSALVELGHDPVCAIGLSETRPDASKIDALLADLSMSSDGYGRALKRRLERVAADLAAAQSAEAAIVSRALFHLDNPPSDNDEAANADGDDDDGNANGGGAKARQSTDVNGQLCVVCDDCDREIALGCGHLCLCANCADQLETCPICRQKSHQS